MDGVSCQWGWAMFPFGRITFDPAILGGQACIGGMRIPASLVVNLVAHGMSAAGITTEYPDLSGLAVEVSRIAARDARSVGARGAAILEKTSAKPLRAG